MGKSSKRPTQVETSDTGSEDEGDREAKMECEEDDNDVYDESGKEDTQEQEGNDSEMEELEKEYLDLRQEEQDLLKNLKHHKDEDLLKGQAIKSQKALWDKNLELRFLLQKAFTGSNRLPQEPIRSAFCTSGDVIEEAYLDLIASSKKTLDSLLALQRVLLEKNPSITQVTDGSSGQNYKHPEALRSSEQEVDEEWLLISEMHSRYYVVDLSFYMQNMKFWTSSYWIASFRDKSIDKWQRKTQVTTGAAAIKGRLQAFNQNTSEQVAAYMRDPSRMIKGMQQRRSAVAIFGTGPESSSLTHEEPLIDGGGGSFAWRGVWELKAPKRVAFFSAFKAVWSAILTDISVRSECDSMEEHGTCRQVTDPDGDPELLDDTEFYQQLLKEFFEAFDSTSSGKVSAL
ncbi:hypothetical protein RJ639_014141 [Escallonia herrerae]|uniref:AATF leucine zipper-containing domain-containing protein n=1 Tax=Escallonia herrerae TaxID=1293975 RepID=A0AA88VP58_9ASTE|nr:hypothetical protein RJ639_014141 [Escallonia herrerae]